jgi:hypothetical protein
MSTDVDFVPQYLDDDLEQGADLTKAKYETPKNVDKFIDTSTGQVIDKDKLGLWEQIKVVIESNGGVVGRRKSGCKRCYGRGYTGVWLDGTPNACDCFLPVKTPNEKKKAQEEFRRWQIEQIKKQQEKAAMVDRLVEKSAEHMKEEYNKKVLSAEFTSGAPEVIIENQTEGN